MAVGIEALAIAVPRRYLELEDLARARGVDPEKFIVGLGCRRMAVPEPGEDSVALAATAARRLIEAADLAPERIGMLAVGSETGVDHSKPIASHVQGLLGLPRAMRVFDTRHACYGGTAALNAAVEWIASGAARGRVAVVICTDIARYGLRTAGEPTQGAGAVAMLVSQDPKVLAIDVGVSGASSSDVYDFWRPHGRREALVDGHYSIQCYLDALSGAYRAWRDAARERGLVPSNGGALASDALERILYHVPFGKMAKKAHAHVRSCDVEDARGGPLDAAAEAAEAEAANESFARRVASSLSLCAEVGNIYTGSLYLGLAGVIHAEAAAVEGRRIGLFSYGSGCCAEFFSGVVGREAGRAVAAARIGEVLKRRERIDVAEYERIMALAADEPLRGEDLFPGEFRFAGVREGRRLYVSGTAGAPARTVGAGKALAATVR